MEQINAYIVNLLKCFNAKNLLSFLPCGIGEPLLIIMPMQGGGTEVLMSRILRYLKPYIPYLFLVLIFVFTRVFCDLALPDYMSDIVDNGIAKGDVNHIIHVGVIMLFVSLLGMLAAAANSYTASGIGANMAKRIRNDVFKKTEAFSLAEFDRFSTASLITRTTNDIVQLQNITIMFLRFIITAPIMGIGGIVLALGKSPSMSWTIALGVIVILGMVSIMFALTTPRFKIIQKLVDKLNLVSREGLTGVMVIRAFKNQPLWQKRFDDANTSLMNNNLFVNRVMSFMHPAMMLVMNIITIVIVYVGARYINIGSLQVGDMMAFIQYAMQIMNSFLMMSMMFIQLPHALVSANRVKEVLETEPSISDSVSPVSFDESKKGTVEFKNVSFAYPDADEAALKNISFTAPAGKTTAIIGSTGSGKSTLINLILRFYDVTDGEILVDGADIRKVRQSDLRARIGYVPQKGVLFSGTVRSNMQYADENASEEEIMSACETAQARDFIEEKKHGYDSEIAQGGSNVSGGQRQRLSIARALVKKSEIYIFDDSFSALDFKTDAALRHALGEKIKGATLIIVAQRINTIMNADRIIVMDAGRVVGIGTHRELLNNCEVYRQIAYTQLSEEELA